MKVRWIHYGCLAGLLLGVGSIRKVHAGPAPLEILKKHGLIKSGKYFLIEEDPRFIPKLNQVKPLMTQLESQITAINAYYRFEAETQNLDDYRISLSGQVESLRLELQNALLLEDVPREYINRLTRGLNAKRQELNVVATNLEQRIKRILSPLQKREIADRFQYSRREFLEALDALRPEFEAILAKYNELKSNSEIREALRVFNTEAQARLEIGPSPGFVRAARRVKEAESWVLPQGPKSNATATQKVPNSRPPTDMPGPNANRDNNPPPPPVPEAREMPAGSVR